MPLQQHEIKTLSFLLHFSFPRPALQPRDRFRFSFTLRTLAIILGRGTEISTSILWRIRLPRTVLIALTGAALGGSGATYQGLFRNPLADPFLIGVASGAGLGAVIAMSINWPYSFWGLMAIPMAAFAAALLTVFIVYSLARVGQTIPTTNLNPRGRRLLILRHFAHLLPDDPFHQRSPPRARLAARRRKSNRLDRHPCHAPYLLIGLGVLVFSGHALNLLQFGDEQAQQLGLERNAHEKDFVDRLLVGNSRRCGFFRHYRIYRTDRPAYNSPVGQHRLS